MIRKSLSLGIMMAASWLAVGCENKNQSGMPKSATVPVTGIVKYKNAGVANAVVTLQSLDGKVAGRAQTDAAGIFSALSTYGKDYGIPPGKYKVMVAVSGTKEIEPGVLAPEPEGGFKSPIPMKYANPNTTDIIVDVKESGKNELLIELK
jgi:hypothetical protein